MNEETKKTGTSYATEQELRQLKHMWQMLSIDGSWFKRQIPVLLLILAGLILYITNRYSAQQEMIREQELIQQEQDWRYRCMTVHSELTTKSRQSQLEMRLHALGDSTLQLSKTPPYEIKR